MFCWGTFSPFVETSLSCENWTILDRRRKMFLDRTTMTPRRPFSTAVQIRADLALWISDSRRTLCSAGPPKQDVMAEIASCKDLTELRVRNGPGMSRDQGPCSSPRCAVLKGPPQNELFSKASKVVQDYLAVPYPCALYSLYLVLFG